MQRCQAASGKNSAALSASPRQASEMISRTPFEAALLEVLEERAPARLVLLGALADAENLPITLAVHADRHQQRHVAHLAGPAALEHDAVQIDVGVLALDRSIAPGLDRPVDLLVQVRHRRWRHPRAPQGFRDVLDPAHRDPGQIHLDQGLLDRALAPPVALDDRRLEGLLPKLRVPSAAPRRPWSAACARSGRHACRGGPRCARSAAHCTADPLRHPASAFNVSSTLPRTTRSRWFLIRSSSIVMTLFSGLGVVSVMAAPSC